MNRLVSTSENTEKNQIILQSKVSLFNFSKNKQKNTNKYNLLWFNGNKINKFSHLRGWNHQILCNFS